MNKIENIILVSCSIKPAVAGIVIFFKPLKYPFKVSLIPTRGIKIIVDSIGKNRSGLLSQFVVSGLIIKNNTKIVIIDIKIESFIASLINLLGDRKWCCKLSATNLLIVMFKLKLDILIKSKMVGKLIIYRLIPAVPNKRVITILFSKPSNLMINPLDITIKVL